MAAEARPPAFLPWAWPWAAGVVAATAVGEVAIVQAATAAAVGEVAVGQAAAAAAVGEVAVVQVAAVAAGSAAAPVGWLVVGSGLALAVALAAVRAAGPGVAAAARLGAWFAAGALLAALRTASVLAAADPWADRLGQEVAFEARVVDGVAWPDDGAARGAARGVVLRGAEVADGRAWLEGRLEALPGRRNPGGFDARAHYRRDGVGAALVVARVEARAPPPATARARAALRRGVVAGLDADAAALMQALTLGLRGDLGPLRDAFAASGLAHVLALSGLHVGVLAAVLVAAVGGVGRVRSLVVVAVLVGYVAVVGPAPAVVRATAMVAFALLGRAFGVGGAGWGSHLALAAAASLLVRPAWVGDLGFQLSYLSVLGMGWMAPPLARRWGTVGGAGAARRRGRRAAAGAAGRRWVLRSFAVSLAAQVATLPLVASAFGAVPLAAPLANLAAVPLASALVPLGFVAGLAGLVGEPLAAAVNLATARVADALLALASATARVPTLPWGAVSWVGYAAYAIGAAAVLAGLHGAWKPWRAAVAVGAAMLVTVAVPPAWRPPDLIVLDVGQGDATVVRVARGQALLIDGGGTPFGDFDVGARTVVPALRALGVGALPLVVATHPDLDHVEGLVAVLGAFPVGALMVGHAAPDVPAYRALTDAAAARGVPVLEARRGARYRVGGAVLDVVHPEGRPRGEANADSVGLVLRWGDDPWALLLGDAPAAVEASLPVPPTPVLLAPHHGSASSSSDALLRAARPRLALVSVGVNRYGHPAPAVLERFAAAGVRVRTTRDEGALRVPYPPP